MGFIQKSRVRSVGRAIGQSRLLAVAFVFGMLGLVGHIAHAQNGIVHTQTTTVSTSEKDELATPTPLPTPKLGVDRDYLVQKVFGTKAESGIDGCKTDDLAERTKIDLEKECKVWMKEQKADLGSKYQTGTCNDECDDCGMSLKRCKVRGVVHYAK